MIRIWHPYRKILLYTTAKFLSRWVKLGFICLDTEYALSAYRKKLH